MMVVWLVSENSNGLGKSESCKPSSVVLGNDRDHVVLTSPSSCEDSLPLPLDEMSDR